jgi:hypothetical protein
MRLEKPPMSPYDIDHKARYLCWINYISKETAMRLYAPIDEGDSIVRPDAALGERAAAVKRPAAPTPAIVHSNIVVAAANQGALDIPAIEQRARDQRNAGFARIAKAMLTTIGAWLERNENHERDYFFAASENLADLEQRQRHFERTGVAHY